MNEVLDMINIAVSREAERQEKTANTQFLEEVDTPSLEKLAFALRHPETWPKNFEWDFSECQSCAMGLAREMWSLSKGEAQHTSMMAKAFAMPFCDAQNMFLIPPKKYGVFKRSYREVTPDMIADRIDRYIKKHK